MISKWYGWMVSRGKGEVSVHCCRPEAEWLEGADLAERGQLRFRQRAFAPERCDDRRPVGGQSQRPVFWDSLDILREYVADEPVDLIYLDPPFNSSVNLRRLLSQADRRAVRRPDHRL